MFDLNKVKLTQDNILIKLTNGETRTDSGLILPDNLETNQIHTGYVINVGPGIAISKAEYGDKIEFEPVVIKEGYLVGFFKNRAIPVVCSSETYFIVSESDILIYEE